MAFKTVEAAADPGKKDPERFLCILFSDQSDKMLVCFRLKFFVDFFEFHGLNA